MLSPKQLPRDLCKGETEVAGKLEDAFEEEGEDEAQNLGIKIFRTGKTKPMCSVSIARSSGTISPNIGIMKRL